jgi:hypothetical protein|tara:strand:+ start:858 stop:1124 length:267 start_codon:yes stop_codon:yes gene_type:complete
MNSSPIKLKQKLSPSAAKKKAARDLKAAKSPYRRAAKADSQKKHRANPGMKGKDYDHKTSSFKSVKANRGNDGKGTKLEGKSNYNIKK